MIRKKNINVCSGYALDMPYLKYFSLLKILYIRHAKKKKI